MPVKYFCDRDGREIKTEDERYYSVSLGVMGSTRYSDGADRYQDSATREWREIPMDRAMLCKKCAIEIAQVIRNTGEIHV